MQYDSGISDNERILTFASDQLLRNLIQHQTWTAELTKVPSNANS